MEKSLFSILYSVCRIVNIVSTAEGRKSFAECKSSVLSPCSRKRSVGLKMRFIAPSIIIGVGD